MTSRPLIFGAVVAALVGVMILAACVPVIPELGPADGSYVESSPSLEIRVTRRPEVEGPVPGAHYAFESRRVGETQWRPVATVRHDDWVDLPSDRIQFVDQNTAYLSMCSIFAVTTDGGASWHVWDAAKVAWARGLVNYGLIESVAVSANGTGTMTLNELAVSRGGPHFAVTTDFGRTWLPASTPN